MTIIKKLAYATYLLHLYSKNTAMEGAIKTTPFNTKKSIENVSKRKLHTWTINTDGRNYIWSNRIERVGVIRSGIPYGAIEIISKRINSPVKAILSIVGVPQTTYNKKKSEHSLLDPRDSELIILITELIDYGIEVFNNEETKFQRWVKKPNLSLGGNPPASFLDTITGINEVEFCLNRIEYGNFA